MADHNVAVERAKDWQTLQQLLYQGLEEDNGRQASTEAFRGHSNREYTLRTSLQRFVGESGRWNLEVQLLRDFNKYAQQYIDEPESFFHLMTLAQHHGLPTRLIDWTYSPLVATYFATGGDPDVDGEVLVVDYAAAHEHMPEPFKNVLEQANTDMLDIDLSLAGLKKLLLDAGKDATEARVRGGTLELFEIVEVIAEFQEQHPVTNIWFFEPPPIDHRIANQSALLAGWYPNDPQQAMDEWLELHPEFFRKVVIPAEQKQPFRDNLDKANINHRTLFPGLDGLATWLTERYKPTATNGSLPETIREEGGS
jgi:hypothetical protein